MHVNIRSLIKNFSALSECISSSKRIIDVIVLSEVGISDKILSMYNIDGYELYAHLRKNKKGGGIMLYIHNNHKFTQIKTHLIHSEGIFGKLTTTSHDTIHILAIYRPPSSNKHLYLRELHTTITNTDKSLPLVITGDINIDLKSYNQFTEHYVNTMSECGLVSAITDYTRIATKEHIITKSSIDHFFVRTRSLDVYSAVLGTALADHRMIILTYGGLSQLQTTTKTMNLINNNKVKTHLKETDWNSINEIDCPIEMYNGITKAFNGCYNVSKYVKNVTMSKRNKQPWITKPIQQLCKKKDKLFLKWKKDPYNFVLKQDYNKLRNKTHKVIEKEKNNYYTLEINKNKSNIKELWYILNKLTGRCSRSIDEVISKAFNIPTIDIKTVANGFANHFSKSNHAQKSCKSLLLPNLDYVTPQNKSIRFKKASCDDVLKLIKQLDEKKSPGVDNIRCLDIKYISKSIADVLAKFINNCVKYALYPNELKTGLVRPIHKKGAYNEYGNYRPITILPIINKIAERYICNQLQEFYTENSIISSSQFGFQPKKSTTSLLSKFTDEVNSHLNEKKHVLLLFIDFSQAFDTLQHDILLEKLNNTGVRGPLLEWCRAYLQNRSYYVKIGDEMSNNTEVNGGTAQGSVIGPIHYLAYVNDLENIIKECSLYQYADDTCLIAASCNLDIAMRRLQNDFTLMNMWAHDIGLKLNAEKTKIVHVHSSHIKNDTQIKIIAHCHSCLHKTPSVCTCCQIESVKHHTYLGLIIDHRFIWKNHIDNVCDKLRIILTKFYLLKNKIPFKILLNMYLALAESIITYGITSYGRTFKCFIDRILNLQLRILKTILPNNIKSQLLDNKAKIFEYCKIIPIHEKIKYNVLVEQYFNFNGEITNSFKNKIVTRSVTENKLCVPRTKNFYGKRTAKYLIPTLINQLPSNIRNSINEKNIKCKLKSYFIDNLTNLNI